MTSKSNFVTGEFRNSSHLDEAHFPVTMISPTEASGTPSIRQIVTNALSGTAGSFVVLIIIIFFLWRYFKRRRSLKLIDIGSQSPSHQATYYPSPIIATTGMHYPIQTTEGTFAYSLHNQPHHHHHPCCDHHQPIISELSSISFLGSQSDIATAPPPAYSEHDLAYRVASSHANNDDFRQLNNAHHMAADNRFSPLSPNKITLL